VEAAAPGLVARDGVVADGPATLAVDLALTGLTGDSDPVAAMARFVRPGDSVGLKLDCMGNPRLVFHPALTRRLIQLIKAVGIPADRIVVWDQFRSRLVRAGYPADGAMDGVRVLHQASPGWQATGAIQRIGKAGAFQWSPLLLKSTAVLNLHAAKDHRYCGISGALVNMALGCITDAGPLHGSLHEAVPRLYARPEISGRVRLNICDAGYVLRQGGPQDHSAHRVKRDAVLASADPVAMDWAVLELVETARKKAKLRSLYDVSAPRRRPPLHVTNAAALGLGAAMHELAWERVTAGGGRIPVIPRRLQALIPTLKAAAQP
jgi:hypothetical protein